MNPGHQRTVTFVLILVTREALSLTAFGDGDYYADVRGGESPSQAFSVTNKIQCSLYSSGNLPGV